MVSPAVLDKFAIRPNIASVSLDPDDIGQDAWWLHPDECRNTAGLPCAHGDGVASWSDHLDGFYFPSTPFVQATGANQPIYRTDAIFPYVRFDGVAHYLRSPTNYGTSAGGNIFMAARMLGAATRTILCTADEGAAANTVVWLLLDQNTPAYRIRRDNGQATDDLRTITEVKCSQRNALNVVRIWDHGAGWNCTVGGVANVGTQVTGVNTGSQMWGTVANRDSWSIGALFDAGGASSFCNFDLFELLVTGRLDTQGQVDRIVNYFRTKYRYRAVAHLGDSWAADTGYGIELRQALQDQFITVYDHGVGSETMTQIGARWDSDVAGKGFDCVILEGAINDLKGVAAGGHVAVFTEFKRIADAAIAEGTKLVACNCGPFGNNNGWSQTRQVELMTYNEKVRNYCTQKSVPLVDLYGFGVNRDQAQRSGVINSSINGQPFAIRPDWELSGGLHFNSAGDAFVARHIADIVRKQLFPSHH